jgi:nucleoside-diphosphate-sugar epimerase
MDRLSSGRSIRTALVTGASGFIGGHLSQELCSSGIRVRALVRDPNAADWLRKSGAEVVVGDITLPGSLGAALAGADTVFHCAAFVHGSGEGSVFESVNVLGTRHLLDACGRTPTIERVVHVSTVAVFGDISRGEVAGESRETKPKGPYGISKLGAERVVKESGLPAVIARPMWVYGSRSPSFVKLCHLIARRRMVLIGGGRNAVQPIAVEDLVEGLILCGTDAKAAGETYNFAGPSPMTTAGLCNEIADAFRVAPPRLNLPLPLAFVAAHLGERLYPKSLGRPPFDRQKLSFFTTEHAYSIDKAREQLGWKPQTGFREGVAKVAETLRRAGRP